MPQPALDPRVARKRIAMIEQCLKEGFSPQNVSGGLGSAVREAARRMGMDDATLGGWVSRQVALARAGKAAFVPDWTLWAIDDPADTEQVAAPSPLPGSPVVPLGYEREGNVVEIVSDKDNRFIFAATGDWHVGSKYFREDVLTREFERYEFRRCQAVFHTGNWIEGDARFNAHDVVCHGIHQQCQLLAKVTPRTRSMPIYAVWGDDHEGWYAQREGIDVGQYAEGIMRAAGHDWHDLGFMEAHVVLRNANTGRTATMIVAHPGGGSSYALSYRPQKIIESLEGGEKPAVLLLGHYHKLDPGLVRNVWYQQTACVQDQTPFMRKKSIEAHVGGVVIEIEQDPETGAIVEFVPRMRRYFNRAYYDGSGRWSKHGPVRPMVRA